MLLFFRGLMTKRRFLLTLNCLLLINLILTACAGAPTIPIPNFIAPATPTSPATTTAQQAFPPALVETDPPLNSVLGHLSPITFYFKFVPSLPGQGEWINTSTYFFYPQPAMAGGTEYAVSLSQSLKSATGVGFESSDGNAWKFVTAKPQVISLSPAADNPIPLNPEIKLTFNQPMDADSVKANFLFNGTEGPVNGAFTWNADGTELTFVPEKFLTRNEGYTLNVNSAAKSRGGVTLGTDYGAVLKTFDNFAVTKTDFNYGTTTFTFSAPLAKAKYEDAVTITPAFDSFDATASDDGLTLLVSGNFAPDTNYVVGLGGHLKDQWDQSLGDPFYFNVRTPPLPSALTVQSIGSSAFFVRPDEPVLYANVTNIQKTDVTVAPLSLLDFFSLQDAFDKQQAYTPDNAHTYSQSFNLAPSVAQNVKLNLVPQNSQLPSGLYYVSASSPQIQLQSKNIYFAVSSQVNLTFKRGATTAFIWAADLPSQSPVANAPIVIYDTAGNQLGSGTTDANGLWQGAIAENDGQLYAVLGCAGE